MSMELEQPDGAATDAGTLPATGIELYQSADGEVKLDVRLEAETVWLTADQMADLFDRDKSVISRHLKSIFQTGELDRDETVTRTSVQQREGEREVTREIDYYNLDAIISVGYRVKSQQGVQFRRWATKTLRQHVVQGYTLNERRLRDRGLMEVERAVELMSRALSAHKLVTDEGRAMLDIVSHYARSWRLLLQYDEDRLPDDAGRPVDEMTELTIEAARKAIATLKADLAQRGEASDLFGRERGEALEGILGNIEQTFGGEPLYPSIEARSAHLLYFVIKDHPFSDGNKRIGSMLFLTYLGLNARLLKADGTPRFDDNALVALALLIAESDPAQKDLLIRLVMNLLAEAPAADADADTRDGAGDGQERAA